MADLILIASGSGESLTDPISLRSAMEILREEPGQKETHAV